MTHIPRLITHQLSYTIPNTTVQFDDLNLSFEKRRYGLIGDNGVGKTTLLQLLVGHLKPHTGHVLLSGTATYCPQFIEDSQQHLSIIEMLGIQGKWHALQRLKEGKMRDGDLEVIGDDWGLATEVEILFQRLELPISHLNEHFNALSGGQKTKILLAKSILASSDFILLDEPTNNLDSASKQLLIEWMNHSRHGFIMVSHDRGLLNNMDEIIEITTKGVNIFGGNYDFYEAQKKLLQEGLKHDIASAEKKLKQFESSIQETREKHQQRQKKGKLLRKKSKIDKLTANSMQGRSEKTQSRNSSLSKQRTEQAKETLKTAKAQLEIKTSIHADLLATHVPNQKNVLTIDNLQFSYTNQIPLFKNFNLTITGPERIALIGNNGCGKSTLIRLIRGLIAPVKGKIACHVKLVRVLDQQCDFLIPSLNLVENFQELNPNITIQDAYAALASMQFRNTDAEKKVVHLSGGERIRAGLAISLLSKIPPQLIILDEPTNHLDLRSIEAIEAALSAYQGAMIVISHDNDFLNNIHITKRVCLT